MLRAIRQSMQLGFAIDPAVIDAVKRNVARINMISHERVRDELSKMLTQKIASQGMRFLQETGLLAYVVPEFEATRTVDQPGPYHTKDVYEHTLQVVDNISPDLVLRLAALLHDIGKPTTKVITDGIAHFFTHEHVGAKMAGDILHRLKFPNDVIDRVKILVSHHMRPHAYKPEWSDAAVRRFVRDLGDHLEQSLQLAEADITGHSKAVQAQNRIQELRERIRQVQEQGEVSKISELLSGNELMALVQQGPGPWIRKVKEFVSDQQMENPALTKEEASALVKTYVQEHRDDLTQASAWTIKSSHNFNIGDFVVVKIGTEDRRGIIEAIRDQDADVWVASAYPGEPAVYNVPVALLEHHDHTL